MVGGVVVNVGSWGGVGRERGGDGVGEKVEGWEGGVVGGGYEWVGGVDGNGWW